MMDAHTLERLRAALGGNDLAWLRKRLRGRIASGRPLGDRAVLRSPLDGERRATERLLGIPGKSGRHVVVRIDDLRAILANLGCADLEAALEALDGPIITQKQLRARENATWARLADEFAPRFAAEGYADEAVAALHECGVLRRITRQNRAAAREVLAAALDVAERLAQASAATSRSALAAETLGDSHALDAGAPVATVLKHLHGMAGQADSELWRRLGVDCDATASTVLILNVRFASGALAEALNAYAEAGEPCRLTLKTLERGLVPRRTDVFVCENPAIVDAASRRLGAACKPLICTEGQPSAACQRLLSALRSAGGAVHYHGDFDWGGIHIANFVYRHCEGFGPWRYTARDYEDLAGGFPLRGTPVAAAWDAGLRPAMTARGLGFHEESVLEVLLGDLR